MESVQIRCPQNRIACATQIAITFTKGIRQKRGEPAPYEGGGNAMNVDIDLIKSWVSNHRDGIVHSIQELIRIPTENRPPTGDEYVGQLYLKGILEGMGADVDVFSPDDVPELRHHAAFYPGRDYTNRPNVVARFCGSGGGRSIGFSSHMDTASRDPLPWLESEPFSGEVKNGRLYGRGSYDMKAGLLASVWAVRAVRELGVPLRGDVMVESVVDEEWGGSNGTLAARLRGHNPDIVVIPEPSHMVVAPAHLGVRIYRITLSGAAGMRFGGESFENPAMGASVVLEAIQSFGAEHQSRPLPAIYAGGDPPPVDVLAIHAQGYGVPKSCSIDFFVHFFEEEGAAAVESKVYRLADELRRHPRLSQFQIDLEPQSRFVEPSSMPADHPCIRLAAEALKALGRDGVVRGAPFACDGYVFNRHSPTQAFILGPGGAAAHAADEYVLIDDVLDLVSVYAYLIVKWAG